jgi:LytR cell envelope-related transcriptional attenuator
MTGPRESGARPSRSSGISSRARGAIVVGLAVIVGIVGVEILNDSGPGSGLSVATDTTAAPATSATPGTSATSATRPTVTTLGATTSTSRATPGAGTASTTHARRPNNQVKVKVYNASGLQGRAQILTNRLKALGYATQSPGDLSPHRKGTVVECVKGFEAEGTLLALYGIGGGATTQPYPSTPPAGSSQADCLVILGTT